MIRVRSCQKIEQGELVARNTLVVKVGKVSVPEMECENVRDDCLLAAL